ncbi:MAG: YfiR family protein [Myxococcota bacterium]
MLAWVAWFAAAAPPTAVEREVLVLVRTLSYDRALDRHVGALRIGIVGAPPAADEVLAVVRGLVGVTVSGRPIAPPTVLAPTPGDWVVRLGDVDVVVLCPGIDPVLADISSAAAARHVGTLALDGRMVGRGAGLGVAVSGDHLEIVVDPVQASAEGARLAGELLELAREVDR